MFGGCGVKREVDGWDRQKEGWLMVERDSAPRVYPPGSDDGGVSLVWISGSQVPSVLLVSCFRVEKLVGTASPTRTINTVICLWAVLPKASTRLRIR